MTRSLSDRRRALPSVSSLLEHDRIVALRHNTPTEAVTTAVRAAIASVRDGDRDAPADEAGWGELVESVLRTMLQPSLRPVLNATGTVLHTNLGRAPLAESALAAIQRIASGFATLEYDLEAGARGSRHSHCVPLLHELTGAEDALIVNNCAAALVLALNTIAVERDVLVSRGELVEIGGSFRIPEIMARSSARLVEVGTTNRTHLLDYRAAITPNTAAIVKVHRSNFAVSGFTAEATLGELAKLGAERGIPVVFDQGSGLLVSLEQFGFPYEPTAQALVEAGASLVLMSGDKLLGGPQAGIILGNADLIAKLRTNPLARALRVDKLTLAALEATLMLYREPAIAVREVPTLAMLTAPLERVRERAVALAARLSARGVSVRALESDAAVGGGAFPVYAIPSAAVACSGDAVQLEERLRSGDPPVIARITADELRLDLRSIPERDDETLTEAVLRALA
jgi:L-seryl-tRNA(Ser) seleniumtransferase